MSCVYSAVHPLIGARVAIKVMRPALSQQSNAVARFVLEARAINRIKHPNILDAFAFGRLPDGRSYFVMEWLDGVTLSDRMSRRSLAFDEVLAILDQVADALEGAHDAGVIHRDLKPANVLLVPAARGRGEQVKLLDFGVAKLVSAGQSQPKCTQDGCAVGTPEYISPEQARGKDVDRCTDVYSLGVMAYEMVAGELPFRSDNPIDLMRLHLDAAVPRVRAVRPDTPAQLDEVIARMMDKEPGNRPTLHELRTAIAALRETLASGPVRARPPRRRRLVPAAMAMTAIAATALVTVLRDAARPGEATPAHAMAACGTRSPVIERACLAPPAAPDAAPPASQAGDAKYEYSRKPARARNANYLIDRFRTNNRCVMRGHQLAFRN